MTHKKADRHSADSAQVKAWLPRTLKARFAACVESQNTTSTAVLACLMEAYCEQVEALAAEGDAHGQH